MHNTFYTHFHSFIFKHIFIFAKKRDLYDVLALQTFFLSQVMHKAMKITRLLST